ncbi:unnamed protein product [Cylindrotheca closterium]|uniref:ShKT domain-containing protein n=1 Tax=Cylindrotheca closterium TaxID=2856 RepID=A0AAD2CT86_9STRA|nr:unnamed protein product [Cylindrotheca closterium]
MNTINQSKEDMIPRKSWPWLFFLLSQNYILVITVSIVFASPVIGDGELYYDCQKNPLECTYGKRKYEASSSPSCSDRHPNCRIYALRGNCIRHFQWMETQCPQSCGICPTVEDALKVDQSTTPQCIDHHPQCPKWASEQECFINPPFINGLCPMSCIRCVNTTVLDRSKDNTIESSSKGDNGDLSNAQIQARIRYSQTDFGDWQTIPRDDLNLVPVIMEILFDMGEYAKELLEEEEERIRQVQEVESSAEIDKRRELIGHNGHPLLGPSTVCNNMRHDCATLVAQHGCHGPYLELMMQECSFACQFCHETDTYHQCRSSSSSSSSTTSSAGDKKVSLESTISSNSWNYHFWEHLSTKHGAVNLAPAPMRTTKFQSEWVLSLDYASVWKDDKAARRQRKELLKVAKSAFEDNEEASCTERTFQHTGRRRRKQGSIENENEGRIATCNGPMNPTSNIDGNIDAAKTSTSPSSLSSSCQELEQGIARLLGIGPEYLEPLEFLLFTSNNKARQVPMSDFDNHDQWRPSGHVLLTVLLVLQPAKKGGAIGFPDLDWLMVTDPAILIWPTAAQTPTQSSPPPPPTTKAEDPHHYQEMANMESELLPVIQGDLYAIKIRVRQYPYFYNPDCD